MDDKPIKHGYLLTPPQGKLLKRTWQKKYYALYKASNYAVERVEVFDSEEAFIQNSSRKIIPLNECIKVAQSPQKHQQNVFDVITKSQSYQFSTEMTQDLAEWVLAFQNVSFGGGQRREIGSSPPPSTVVPHTGHVYRSSSNAEEENQIYSSYSGRENYSIKIVDTDASLACGLSGEYLLVVSALQLLLYKQGVSLNGKNYLYAWPYRHIRRYGRNKDKFTFEAGRKCASGAGTFTFATSDSNSIFLNVQTYTRALKREEEDAAQHAPSILLNKPLTSPTWSAATTPNEEEPPTKPFFVNEPPRSVSSSTDADSSVSRGSDSKENSTILSRVLSRNKALAPFPKPPRKSKLPLGSSSSVGEKPISEPIRFEISPAARAKLAESTTSVCSTAKQTVAVEPVYAVCEVRTEAWKTFGMEKDNIHVENISAVDENFDKSVTISPTSPSSTSLPWLPTSNSEKPKMMKPLKRVQSDSTGCYDHLSQFCQQTPKTIPAVSFTDGHIYSKLLSVNGGSGGSGGSSSSSSGKVQTDCQSNSSESSGNSEIARESTTTTCNNNNNPGVPSIDVNNQMQNETETNIQRFIQNEDVYTVIAKPVRKAQPKPTNV